MWYALGMLWVCLGYAYGYAYGMDITSLSLTPNPVPGISSQASQMQPGILLLLVCRQQPVQVNLFTRGYGVRQVAINGACGQQVPPRYPL